MPKPSRASIPQPDHPYLVCSYRVDFPWLWKLDGDDRSGLIQWVAQEANPTIIVVWDGMPAAREPTINVADYVTPYDWAIACSWVVFNHWQSDADGRAQAQLPNLPRLRILILDLSSQLGRSAFWSRQFNMLSPSLPWICVYRPLLLSTPLMPNALASLPLDVLQEVLNAWRVGLGAMKGSELTDLAMSILRTALPVGALGIDALLQDAIRPKRVQPLQEAQALSNRMRDFETARQLIKNQLVRPASPPSR